MEAIYTWKDFLEAVCTYNKWAEGANEPAFLGDSDVKIKAMTVVGMMANVKVETLHWTACKESQQKNNLLLLVFLHLVPFWQTLPSRMLTAPLRNGFRCLMGAAHATQIRNSLAAALLGQQITIIQ